MAGIPPGAVSQDRTATLVIANVTSDGEAETIADPVKDARDIVGNGEGGLEVRVTGPAGYSADAIKVFEQINGSLIGAAFLLVFVLLIFIYRSPILLWFPLLAVAFAEIVTRGIGWALTEAGVTVTDSHRPSCRCWCWARAPTMRCCSWPGTGRSCGGTRTAPRR